MRRRDFIGWLGAFVAFFRLSLPQPERRVLVTPNPIVDPRASGNFWCVEEAPGQIPVTTYGNWEMGRENGRVALVETAQATRKARPIPESYIPFPQGPA